MAGAEEEMRHKKFREVLTEKGAGEAGGSGGSREGFCLF